MPSAPTLSQCASLPEASVDRLVTNGLNNQLDWKCIMADPVTVNIPHKLGVEEAKSRIGSGIHTLSDIIPGASLTGHHWEGDHLHFTLEAIGQRISADMHVREEEVYALFDLPPMLAMFANKIKAKLQKEAPKMLE